jgi:YidC/Oxa1 family membrane protein insertase
MQQGSSRGLDGRTLLAFALMIVILVVFSRFLGPQPPPEPETSEAPVAGEVQPAAGTPASGAVPAGEPPADQGSSSWTRADEEEEAAPAERFGGLGSGWRLENRLAPGAEEIVVESDLYRAVFSAHGGVLRSWQLKRYTDAEEAPADLVAAGEPGALGLFFEGPEGQVDLSATRFALERRELPARELRGGERLFPETGETAASGDERIHELRFVAEGPLVRGAANDAAGGDLVRVERIYRLGESGYDIEMDLLIEGIANPRQDHTFVLAWERGIPNVETQRNLEKRAKGIVALLGEELVKDDFGGSGFGCQCGGGKASQAGDRFYEGTLRWAGVRGKYFAGLVIPEREAPATVVASSEPEQSIVGMRLRQPLGDGVTAARYLLYIGPLDAQIINTLEHRVIRDVTKLVDYGGKLIAPISKVTHWFLVNAHSVVPNYGVVIIILAILVQVIFHPLTIKSLQSQRKLQLLKPELDELNKKYKDNPELRTKKTMELHKKHGVNPLGGCLPLIVQMPVIYALYNVLMNALELRKAPFVLWMQDLSAPDTVGQAFGIPINILPLLMAATMFWQQRMMPTDPRQAPMLLLMPLMMVFFFYGLPSGLVLYWTMANLLAIARQMMLKPQTAPAVATAPAQTKEAPQKGAKRAKAR